MKLQVTASAYIKASTKQVYAILADYHGGHPYVLPKRYFSDLQVEQGGIGAGTIIRFQMHVLGKAQAFRAAITEPEPGRLLVETNLPSGAVTTFTVDPRTEGQHTQVTITTEMETREGLLGLMGRFLTTVTLRRIYAQELGLLAARAEKSSVASSANVGEAIAQKLPIARV